MSVGLAGDRLSLGGWMLVMAGVAGTLGAIACSGPDAVVDSGAPQLGERSTEPQVLATIDGGEITMDDLDDIIGDQLEKMEFEYLSERHRLIESTLENEVVDRLLEGEAETLGISKEELVESETAAAPPLTQEDVAAWYRQNESRLGGRSLQELSPQIEQYLGDLERQRLILELADRLEQQREVRYQLQPFRASLADAGFPDAGPETAPVTLVEFSDFECPYCGGFVETLEQVQENYGDRVRVVFRQFPLDIHPNAPKAAEASLCAHEQGKFWPLHDLMFDEQHQLDVDALKEKAARVELDRAAFDACLDSGRHAEQVQEDIRQGVTVGVSGTPAVFVNGIPVPGGAVPYELLSEMIDDELGRIDAN